MKKRIIGISVGSIAIVLVVIILNLFVITPTYTISIRRGRDFQKTGYWNEDYSVYTNSKNAEMDRSDYEFLLRLWYGDDVIVELMD